VSEDRVFRPHLKYSSDHVEMLTEWHLHCLMSLLDPLQSSGCYMYRQFNIKQFHVLPIQCIYVFYVDLRTNSHYFPIQH